MNRFLALALLAALPAGAAETSGEGTTAAAPRPVVSIVVSRGTTGAVDYVGTVTARIEANLGFPLSGTIVERPVSAGELVRAGAILARLEPQDFDAALRSAEAGVTVAEAQLRSASNARDRVQELARRGVASSTQLEDASRALVAAEARVEQAKATRDRAKDQLDLATLKAPQAGVVTAVHAEPGTTVSAGQPVLTLAGTEDREIVIDLAEQDVASYPTGTAFEARLAANPAIAARAVLDRIDPVADQTTRTRRLHLSVEAAPDAFRLGALVRIEAKAGSAGGIAVPVSSVTEADGKAAVWVVDRADDTVHRRSITTGETLGDFIVVLTGLNPGDEVVTRGIHSIGDGQVVGPRVAP